MEPGLRLWLVRHGQTAWNASGLCLGRTDLPLNQFGRETVLALKNRIDINACDVIYCSPSKRALETARILIQGHSKPIRISRDLQEINFGTWEGKSWQYITENRYKEWIMWKQDPLHSAPYGGESLEDVAERMARLYRVLQEGHEGQTLETEDLLSQTVLVSKTEVMETATHDRKKGGRQWQHEAYGRDISNSVWSRFP